MPGDRETLQERVNLSLHMANIGLERSKENVSCVMWVESFLSDEDIELLSCQVEVIQELKKYCRYYIRVVPKSVEVLDDKNCNYCKILAENMGVFFLVIKENISKDYTPKEHDEFVVRMIRICEFFDKFVKEIVYKCQRCCPNCCPY